MAKILHNLVIRPSDIKPSTLQWRLFHNASVHTGFYQFLLFLALTVGCSSLLQAETVPGLQVAASVPVSKAVVKINPIFEYPSVFTGYSFFKDQAPASWQKSNQTVQQIGGWRAYAKEVHTPEALSPSSSHQHHKVDENKSKP